MTEIPYEESEPSKVPPIMALSGIALIIVGFFNLGAPQETVFRHEYGELWPYPEYSEAVLGCTSRQTPFGQIEYVTIKLGDIVYGLNGTAQSYLNLPDSRSRMLVSPDGIYTLGAAAELNQRGQQLC